MSIEIISLRIKLQRLRVMKTSIKLLKSLARSITFLSVGFEINSIFFLLNKSTTKSYINGHTVRCV